MKNKPIKASIVFLSDNFCFNKAKKKEINHPSIKTVQVNLESTIEKKQFSSPQPNKKTIQLTTNNNRPSSQRKKEEKKLVAPIHIKTPSIKEEIRKRNCRSLVKPQIYLTPKKKQNNSRKNKQKQTMSPMNNYNNNANSNCILTTNFTETKTEKKKSKTKNIKACDTSLSTIQHLRNIFLTSTMKKTFLIDEKGNTNLNMKLNANNNNDNNMALYRKTFCSTSKANNPQPLFNELSNKDIKKNSESDKSTIVEPIEGSINKEKDIKVIKYEALFNLLNQNLMQMKNSFENNINNNLNNHDSLLFATSQFEVFTQKERDEIDCITNNHNKDNAIIHNSKADYLSNNSFLDSYYKEDLFHSFIKASSIRGSHHTETPSFNYSTTIRNQTDSNLNTNYDQTECCDDIDRDRPILYGTHQPYLINPRLLLKNLQSRNSELKCKKKNEKDYLEQNQNCCIF